MSLASPLREENLKMKKEIFLRMIPLGIMLGTGLGGYVMRFSRKYTFVVLTMFGMVLCGLSVIDNMYVLFVARALYGVVGGLILNLTPKMIQETVPRDKFLAGYGALPHLAIETYKTIDMLINNSIHKYEKLQGVDYAEAFKLHYLIVIPFFLIAFLLFIIFARFETLTHYVHQAKKSDAIYLLKRIIKMQPDAYYEKKYKEIRKLGYFWTDKPIVSGR